MADPRHPRRANILSTQGSRRSFLLASLVATSSIFATINNKAYAMTAISGDDRYARGLDVLRRIGGKNFDGPIKKLAETSADLARFTVEYPYGDVLSRPGIDLQLRQLCTVSMLLADGRAQPQLRFHIDGFLNAGGEPKALVELMFVAVALLGFPSAINAVGILRAVFADRKLTFVAVHSDADDGSTRERAGLATLKRLAGGDVRAYFDGFSESSPDLARLSITLPMANCWRAGDSTTNQSRWRSSPCLPPPETAGPPSICIWPARSLRG